MGKSCEWYLLVNFCCIILIKVPSELSGGGVKILQTTEWSEQTVNRIAIWTNQSHLVICTLM